MDLSWLDNVKFKFWSCPDCPDGRVAWDINLAICLECGKTNQDNLKWQKTADAQPPEGLVIDALVRHKNPDLQLPDQIIKGYVGCDNLYLKTGGELSYNWDIIKWKESDEQTL